MLPCEGKRLSTGPGVEKAKPKRLHAPTPFCSNAYPPCPFLSTDGGFMNTIEKSIQQEVDKYDFLIVFANEEGKEADPDKWLYPHEYM